MSEQESTNADVDGIVEKYIPSLEGIPEKDRPAYIDSVKSEFKRLLGLEGHDLQVAYISSVQTLDRFYETHAGGEWSRVHGLKMEERHKLIERAMNLKGVPPCTPESGPTLIKAASKTN